MCVLFRHYFQFFFNHLILSGKVVTKYRAIFISNSLQHHCTLLACHILQTILRPLNKHFPFHSCLCKILYNISDIENFESGLLLYKT